MGWLWFEGFRKSAMTFRQWTREENLSVLYLRNRGMSRSGPAITELAEAMERSEASIWMLKVNFDSLDPSVPEAGLERVAELTRIVWSEYQHDPKRILSEARAAYRSILVINQVRLERVLDPSTTSETAAQVRVLRR